MLPFQSLASKASNIRLLKAAIITGVLMTSACIFTADEATDPECETYCDASLDACRGANAVFDSRSQCLDECSGINRGTQADNKKGDTLICRITHLEFALEDPATHCPHSRPEPTSPCIDQPATPCERYCAQFIESCSSPGIDVYTDRDDCLAQCNTFTPGESGAVGDTLACRTDTLFSPPADLSPVDQCKEAGPESTICVDADEQDSMSKEDGEADPSE